MIAVRRISRRERTAHHEGAHLATAAIVGGTGVVSATIAPRFLPTGGIALGRVVTTAPRTDEEKTRAGLVLLAGSLGDRLLTGRPHWPSAQSDLVKLYRLLDGDVRRMGKLYVAAQRLVRANWEGVELAASALLAEDTIEGRDLAHLVTAIRRRAR